MQGVQRSSVFICNRCQRARALPVPVWHLSNARRNSSSQEAASPPRTKNNDGDESAPAPAAEKEQGAMSRRLSQMSEEGLETGGHSARKAVEEAGFSEELKRRLEEKIASANFRSDNASALAQANLPAGASKHTRELAATEAWTGTESVGDASLRMLNDSFKPLRMRQRVPGIRGMPNKVDTGRPTEKPSTGSRLANARDKTSVYAVLKDPNMSEEEREKFRQELKQRFEPGSRAVPATIAGLSGLANKRIEDAIARGQFKNLPRGKKIERDYNASSPFINTTEYFMNKIIQKQEIVPPWIEKQQELVSTVTKFRGRLRADWRRHVARSVSSMGGSLETQMERARQYAIAETVCNPKKRNTEQINTVDSEGHLSQITLESETKPPSENGDSSAETEIKILEQMVNDDGSLKSPDHQVTITSEEPDESSLAQSADAATQAQERSSFTPFRDPQWEQTEGGYLRASIENLNNLTRSYNLMAPDLAKKPYYSLDREMKSCFADVAPQIPNFIRERALAPKIKGVQVVGHTPGGVLEKFSMDTASHVYDEQKPQYGFKQFWRDLFASPKS